MFEAQKLNTIYSSTSMKTNVKCTLFCEVIYVYSMMDVAKGLISISLLLKNWTVAKFFQNNVTDFVST
jgi:hypothetical protein